MPLIPIALYLAQQFAPQLIAHLAGPGAGAVAQKVIDIAQQATGTATPQAAVAALQASPDAVLAFQKAVLDNKLELEKLAAQTEQTAVQAVTDRWKLDMGSDSWLSKNVRPVGLVWVYINLTVIIICDLAGRHLSSATMAMVEQVAGVILGAYFVGRTVQHVVNRVQKRKEVSPSDGSKA